MTVPPVRFRPDLEGLRAVAVVLVVAHHVGVPHTTGGFVGVDVFFVLSGYLITWLLVSEAETTGRIDYVRFYARRARRLVPALALVLVATVAAMAVLYAPSLQVRWSQAASASAVYLSNVYYAAFQVDYFSPWIKDNPFLHTWSLGVEEQFYVVWPLVVAGATGLLGRARPWLWVGGLTAASLAASLVITATHPTWAFYLSPTRAWQFGAGGLAVLLPLARWETAWVREGLGWAGLAGLAAATVGFGPTTPYPGGAALLPTLATVALLRVDRDGTGSLVGRALSVPPARLIGRVSYSWYLWHWPVLVVGGGAFPGVKGWGNVGLAALALGLAAATYVLVESPARSHATLVGRPRRSLLGALAVTAAVVALAVGWGRMATGWASLPAMTRITDDVYSESRVFEAGCATSATDAGVRECTFGPEAAPRTALVIGDSWAAHYFPLMEPLLARGDWRVTTLVKLACPLVDAPQYSAFVGGRDRPCESWQAEATERARALAPDLAVVAISSGYPFAEDVWAPGVARALAPIVSASEWTLVIDGVPLPIYDVSACVGRRAWQRHIGWPAALSAPCADLDQGKPPADRVWPDAPSLVRYDFEPLFCADGRCPPARGGRPVYSDGYHPSHWVVKEEAPAFAATVDRLFEGR